MTRGITITALTCVLVAGAAATSILARDSVPVLTSHFVENLPVSNWESKNDKFAGPTLALASLDPDETTETTSAPLRLDDLTARPADREAPKLEIPKLELPKAEIPKADASKADASKAPAPATAATTNVVPQLAPIQVAPPKPKAVAAKPAPQKSYALLSEAQIAGIKERLKLSSSQEYYWPGVESALRAIARKLHASRQADPSGTGVPALDPDGAEVQQLKSAAMPLLFQLREDQKREVRALARIIGLEKVAAQI